MPISRECLNQRCNAPVFWDQRRLVNCDSSQLKSWKILNYEWKLSRMGCFIDPWIFFFFNFVWILDDFEAACWIWGFCFTQLESYVYDSLEWNFLCHPIQKSAAMACTPCSAPTLCFVHFEHTRTFVCARKCGKEIFNVFQDADSSFHEFFHPLPGIVNLKAHSWTKS